MLQCSIYNIGGVGMGKIELTKEVANKIAIKTFGTCNGLKLDKNEPDTTYTIDSGVFTAKIYSDENYPERYMLEIWIGMVPVHRLLYFHETLERDITGEYFLLASLNKIKLEYWISTHGSSYCHKYIDDVINGV